MSATLGPSVRGTGGDGPFDPAKERRSGLSEERLAELQGLDAKQAIDTLQGDFAEGKPSLDNVSFPGPIAEACYWDDRPVVAIQGPVGSGKTTTVLKSRLRRATSIPRSVLTGARMYDLILVRETYRQLWETTIPDFLGVFPRNLGDWSGGRGGPVTFSMAFDDGSTVEPPPGHEGDWTDEILFRARFLAFGDNVEASMRGLKPTDIMLHEMDTNPRAVMMNALSRINRYPDKVHFRGYPPEYRDYGQIIGDMNAPEPDNWTVPLFHDVKNRTQILEDLNKSLPEGTKPIDIGFHRQPGYGEEGCENLPNLGPSYYPTFVATARLMGRGHEVDRLVYNKIVHTRVGEPVFNREFNARLHVAPARLEPWPGVPIRVGLDQGFKGAAVIGQVLVTGEGRGRRARWRILHELHFPNERLLARVFGDRLRDLLEKNWKNTPTEAGWGDLAGEAGSSLANEENENWNRIVSRAAGFPIRPQRMGANRVTPRLEAVRAQLEAPIYQGEPGLQICPVGCPLLISGFEARYVWGEEVNAQGDKYKTPNKSFTEANVMDALQYLLLSEARGDGLTPQSAGELKEIPRLPGAERQEGGGLTTDYDITNPYGD